MIAVLVMILSIQCGVLILMGIAITALSKRLHEVTMRIDETHQVCFAMARDWMGFVRGFQMVVVEAKKQQSGIKEEWNA